MTQSDMARQREKISYFAMLKKQKMIPWLYVFSGYTGYKILAT